MFHIDLLTPYQETELHGANYSRPAPDLVDNEEEYEVEKVLDFRQFGRTRKKQYLIKWKGYPDSDNEWVDKRDIHAPEAIREFESRNSTRSTHIRRGDTSKSHTSSPLQSTTPTTKLISFMSDVNRYYLGSPERIFGAELEEGNLSLNEAQELCAKKYIRPHITDENLLVAPLTEQELASVLLVFPDLQMEPMPPRALSPMVRRLSDPDNMGATPTHQSEVQDANTNIWGPKDGRAGEIPLPVPFEEVKCIPNRNSEGMLDMEGGAVRKSRRSTKHQDGSKGSSALADTPTMHGPWSCTTSGISREDLYPAEHLFIRTIKDSDDPEEMPYAATTLGFPLYKGSYWVKRNEVPAGFEPNNGDHFISFPIKGLDGNVKQAEYVQVILHPSPIVVRLHNDSNKVYTQPLYAAPVFHYDGKPVYRAAQLKQLKEGAEGQDRTDRMIHRLNDPLLTAEVHRFHMIGWELGQLEEAIAAGEDQWGELVGMHCKTIRRLEMADALARIEDQDEGPLDDALRSVGESSRRGHRA